MLKLKTNPSSMPVDSAAVYCMVSSAAAPKHTQLLHAFQVLFGLLTGTENQYTSRSGALSSQELHNILPLASSQIR